MKLQRQRTAIMVVGLIWSIVGCTPDEDPSAITTPPQAHFERKGEPPSFANICRYRFADPVQPLVILETVLAEGGQTCFSDGAGLLFVPRRLNHCPSILGTGGVSIKRAAAEQEFIRCAAIAQPSSAATTDVVIFRPNPTYDGTQDFMAFALDVGALATADMLPATHFGATGGVVCLEGPDGQRIADHVADADIVSSEAVTVSVMRGTCRETAGRLLDQGWPEVSSRP